MYVIYFWYVGSTFYRRMQMALICAMILRILLFDVRGTDTQTTTCHLLHSQILNLVSIIQNAASIAVAKCISRVSNLR